MDATEVRKGELQSEIEASLQVFLSARAKDRTGASSCSFCKITVNADSPKSRREAVEQSFKRLQCRDIVVQEDWKHHKCESSEATGNMKLLKDLERLMLSGEHSDVTVKVKGEKFQLHRSILGGRNAIFDTMFKAEIKEKATGIVTIDDCEPEAFRAFVHYLYTGRVDGLSPKKVLDLFLVADKYQEEELKEVCFQCMRNALTEDTFCDFIALAMRYKDKKLLRQGTEFFSGNMKKIIRTSKWHGFLKENPTQANELYIKALDEYERKNGALTTPPKCILKSLFHRTK